MERMGFYGGKKMKGKRFLWKNGILWIKRWILWIKESGKWDFKVQKWREWDFRD